MSTREQEKMDDGRDEVRADGEVKSSDGVRETSLDLPDEELHELARAFSQMALDSVVSPAALPVFPETSARALAELFRKPLPDEGCALETLADECRQVVAHSRQNGHPRMFGYVASPASPAGALAAWLAATLNQNVTSWRSSPAATEVERNVVRWLAEMIGYTCAGRNETCGGLLTSGGSLANLNALYVAHRTASRASAADEGATTSDASNKTSNGLASSETSSATSSSETSNGVASHDPSRDGLWNAGAPMTVYASEEVHFSIPKAADILGLGRDNVRLVPTDERFRIDVRALKERIESDVEKGFRPFCVVASAGTVSTGAVDALAEVARVARSRGLWFHVDGAYGALAASARGKRAIFDGLEEADSLSLDPHKWLYAPVGTGCIIYREPERARAAFAGASRESGYVKVFEQDDTEAHAFWDYGAELSRPFRALAVWAALRYYGARRIAASIAEDCALAAHMAELIGASVDFELLAPVTLGICCFRYASASARRELERTGDESERERINTRLDELNARIMQRVQRGGAAYLSNAVLRGRFALRASITNFRTTRRDIQLTLDAVRRAAREVEETQKSER
jgi:glutamate/tyrosine decarboxylase-like PLP-dependent enzyme